MRPRTWRYSVKTASPFEYLSSLGPLVAVRFDGVEYHLPEGENLAASLLAASVRITRRSQPSGEARAPFCMMGTCFECRVRIDGVTRRACMMVVSKGLVVEMLLPPGKQADAAG